MSWIGLVLVAAAVVTYLVMLGLHRFTYRSWIFHIPVGIGAVLAIVGLVIGSATGPGIAALALTAYWVWVMTFEIGVRGSEEFRMEVGEDVPPFDVVTVSGEPFTQEDLKRNSPALLQLYRGWWCPSSEIQLEEIVGIHEELEELGYKTYAASVDSPEEAAPLQQKLGSAITLLCNVQNSTLDAMGVEDRRGAAWYSRLTPGVQKRPIAMPSAVALDESGTVVYSFRSTRVDERAKPDEILEALAGLSKA